MPAVLTAFFGIFITALIFGSDWRPQFSWPVVLICLCSYALVIGVLVRAGLRNVRQLEMLSLTDSLSHLPNRRALHLNIKSIASTQGEVAVALIDLDGFKMVNDHYGHGVGDRLIIQCAKLLQEICGRDGTTYRLGGDEFAIVLSGPIAGNVLESICRRLIARLAKPIELDDRAITLGASIGLTHSAARQMVDSSELLRQADIAMYASKDAGKMRCTWYRQEFDDERQFQQDLDHDLRLALANGEFRVAYQPLVSVDGERIVAVEALIRWERPDGRKIGPNIFIPTAEKSGLINAIGLWVLRQALQDAKSWNDVKISVNVSASQLHNPDFPIELGNLLEEFDFPPERLELEVTETQLVLDSDSASRILDLIRSFGVRVALDDFGTGYASIGFLRQCRFEKLKLDRSLIVDSIESESSRAMMMASVTLARSLDMDVTAEGVETEAQADLARIAGCDQIQGWLYYKAMPADELSALLASSESKHAMISQSLPMPKRSAA
jgi:diguanylate cyclase (GGDEF)-like protein